MLHWSRAYKLPVNCIRIFNAYGTRSKTSGAYGAVFGVFLAQKLAGKPFTVVGDGTQRRDFLYVTDVARAFYLAAMTDKVNHIWNLGAGNPQPVNRLVELLGGPVIHLPKRPGEPDCTWADITKITRDLGWKQLVPFEQGVANLLANIEYWRQAPCGTRPPSRRRRRRGSRFWAVRKSEAGGREAQFSFLRRSLRVDSVPQGRPKIVQH